MPPETYAQDPVAQAVEIALLKQTVESQAATIARLATAVEAMESKVDGIATTLAEARGGWRAVAFIGGIGATAGGAVAWIIQHVRLTP